MKKKYRKRLLKRLLCGCCSAIKLLVLALFIALFIIQLDTVRMVFVRTVVSETLRHCPVAQSSHSSEPKHYQTLLPQGDTETVHQNITLGHRNLFT